MSAAAAMDPAVAAERLRRERGLGSAVAARIRDRPGGLAGFVAGPQPPGGKQDPLVRAWRLLQKPDPAVAQTVAGWRERFDVHSIFDPDVPAAMGRLTGAPLNLFVAGTPLAELPRPRIVVVGTRRPSTYGNDTARALARDLASAGASVGSGLALGIDAAAHSGALEGGGTTWACLGSAPDDPQPSSHVMLAQRMLEAGGSLISEYPPGSPVRAHNFAARNRILAALADVVVVVEGGVKSGALITAEAALELGVEVMAVPGRITDPEAAAPLKLLVAGAAPATSASDVLAAAGWADHRQVRAPELAGVEVRLRRILEALPPAGRAHVDELAGGLGMAPGELLAELLELELLGWVQALPGKYYRRSVPARVH